MNLQKTQNAMRKLLLFPVLILSFCVMGCGQKNQVEDLRDLFDDQSITATNQYDFLSLQSSTSLSSAEQLQLNRLNGLTFPMMQKFFERKSESFVFSPASLGCLLGLLAEGAAGNTYAEINKLLGGIDGENEPTGEFFRDYIVLSSSQNDNVGQVNYANLVLADNHMRITENYKKQVKEYFDASASNIDFTKVDITKYINEWAAEKTKGKITKVTDKVNGSVCFLNCLYFKGSWLYPFDYSQTSKDSFFQSSGKTRKVDMMHKLDLDGNFGYAVGDGFRMVRMKYGVSDADSKYSMLVLLPDEGNDIGTMISRLNAKTFSDVLANAKGTPVQLSLPRFDVALDENMVDILSEMGLSDMFLPGIADFSRMSSSGLFVTLLKHITTISVGESGSEAASASYAEMNITDTPPEVIEYKTVNCNRPFAFFITDNATGGVLFAGCYQ